MTNKLNMIKIIFFQFLKYFIALSFSLQQMICSKFENSKQKLIYSTKDITLQNFHS